MARTYGFSIAYPGKKELKMTNKVKTKPTKDLIKSGKYNVAEITLIGNELNKINGNEGPEK